MDKKSELLRVSEAARYVGVHTDTLRRWAEKDRLPCVTINARGDRRSKKADLDKILGRPQISMERRPAIYVRVSGSTLLTSPLQRLANANSSEPQLGQETSLMNQEKELLKAIGEIDSIKVFKDRASGLNEKRSGLNRLLERSRKGEFNEIWVTDNDRLTRFGQQPLTELFLAYGATVHVLHANAEQSNSEELMQDFMALIASFSGRLYGQRSAEARQRLLTEAKENE